MVGRLGSALAVCLLATCFAGCAVAQSGDSTSDSSALHGPSFVPDSKFAGSALTGWHILGQADGRAKTVSSSEKRPERAVAGWYSITPSRILVSIPLSVAPALVTTSS